MDHATEYRPANRSRPRVNFREKNKKNPIIFKAKNVQFSENYVFLINFECLSAQEHTVNWLAGLLLHQLWLDSRVHSASV